VVLELGIELELFVVKRVVLLAEDWLVVDGAVVLADADGGLTLLVALEESLDVELEDQVI